MRLVLASARKDLRRIRRDPLALVLWVGIPLFVAAVLVLIFGRGGRPPQGRLLVADEDRSFASSVLLGVFQREPLRRMLPVEKVSRDEGRRRMDRGEASALLVAPRGFGDAVRRRQPFEIELVTNPSERILPGIAQEVVETALERLATPSGAIPTIRLEVRALSDKPAAQPDVALLFLPGMLFLSILFLAGNQAGDVWTERAAGTLRRFASSPGRLEQLLGGKLCATGVVLLLLASAALAGARLLLGSRGNAGVAIVWVVFSGLALYLLFLAIQLYASSQRAAEILMNLIMFPLAMVGGSFFPFETMPAWMAAIGRRTPNGWAVAQLKAILDGAIDPAPLAAAFAGLSLVGALAFWIAVRRVRRAFLV